MNALEIKDLCKKYDGFSLDHLNLTLPQGCIMGLVGENGAGKSTTIRLILDMLRRDGGTITILGRDNRDNLHLTKEDIGIVFDEVGISDCLTPRQVGKVMKSIYKNWDPAVYNSNLEKFRIPTNKEFKQLSRGMKMKLGIAVALSHHAKLLILDEATSGLDPVVRDEIMDVFLEFTRDEQHSILISSHIVSDLEKICDYIAFLHKGKLVLCEEKDRLKDQFGIILCDAAQLQSIPEHAIIGKKENPYGIEAIVQRDEIAPGLTIHPVDIEQLFIFMTKEV